MSSAMPAFDTLKYAESLQAAGVPEVQAKAHARAAADACDVQLQRLATKEDLRVLGAELRGELAELRSELRGEIADLRGDMRGMRGEIDQVRNMLRWMAGPSLIGTMATVAGMVVLMFKNFA